MTINTSIRRKGILLIALVSPAALADNSLADYLFLTRSVYSGNNATVTVGQYLPPGATVANRVKAIANGSYPGVFNNDSVDGSFGVTSPIYLDAINTGGQTVQTLNLTAMAAASGVNLATSFPSKSEIATHMSSDGKSVTLMGYIAPVNTLDVSNSNTPNHVDTTNPVVNSYQRAVAQFDITGSFYVTPVDAYSGNNGRAAILANNVNGSNGLDYYYMVGNAGNGSGTAPDLIVSNTGVQITTPKGSAVTTVVGEHQGTTGAKNGSQYGFSIAQEGYAVDKSGKDNNLRGSTIFNNTLYVSKGSGGNGINTVYQVGTAGQLPTAATAASTAINILPGFNTTPATTATTGPNPFGLWFANASTLYVADEGDGVIGDAATSPYAGLQKWVLSDADHLWHNVYTLQNGLNLGVKYVVTGGKNADGSVNPSGTGYYYPNAATTVSTGPTSNDWVETDGLRNITGKLNGDGTVTIYGITSTVSLSGDQGADPNRLVAITDNLLATTLPSGVPSGESFSTLRTARYGEVLRGVTFIQGDD